MNRLAMTLTTILLTAASALPATAQTIPIRTVPVASGDQFRILPSQRAGMGGVSIAIDDSIADGWSNPALGALTTETAFLGSPTFYSISDRGGNGRTFPVAGLFRGDSWFGGASLALQQIEDGDGRQDLFFGRPGPCCIGCCGGPTTLSDRFGRNIYATGYVGRRLDSRWAVGLGASAAGIGAMDGVDLLYQGSDRIDQSGNVSDIRIGAFREGPRDRLALVLLHNRVSMTHDVTWTDWTWDPDLMQTIVETRIETNHDETRTWGGSVTWDRALSAPGWRIGLTGTMNYKDHPKIPNYTLQNIPRDPGTTWAYEAGFGFSRSLDGSVFALDVAVLPIWSQTWQVANAEDVADSSGRLSVGDRSIENDFFFTNATIRSGVSLELNEEVDFQAGLEIRSYAYHLEQVDHVRREYREQDESWIEWSPTFGALFRFEALELRYAGRVTTGTGNPGVGGRFAVTDEAMPGGDFILAPEGPLTLQDAEVVTHQLSVRIPVR